MLRFILPILLLTLLCPAAWADSFESWLNDFKRDAGEQGISTQTLDAAFANTEVLDNVIELDRKQPESMLTFEQYLTKVVSEKRIHDGRKQFAEHKTLLKKIGSHYGVPPRFIVALWGIETNYGSNTGSFSVIDSLATLAYEGRRSEFFRGELIKALKIVDDDHIGVEEMQGSWAGAMGQCQFMPSSFINFAVDYNHDGKRDIWNNQGDVFASIANYLSSSGWNGKDGWGRAVLLPDNFDMSLADITQTKPMSEWRKLGLRNIHGGALPKKDIPASLAMVGEGDDAKPYLVYNNYKVLLKWNRSRYFATAVGTLADAIEK